MADINNFNKESLGYLWGNKIKPGLAEKIDKVPSATSGHLAKFNGSGQVVDGGDTADYAKNLVAPVVQSDAEFVYRKTGGSLAVDGAGGAVLQKIKGKTLAWNQIFPGWRNGIDSKSISTNTSKTLDQDNNYGTIGHKYYFGFDYWGSSFSGSANVKLLQTGSSSVVESLAVTSSRKYTSYVYTCNRVDTNNIDVTVSAGTLYIDNAVQIDLTLLYGSEISGLTDTQIKEKYEKDYLGYHPVNPGTLISNDASAIETVGFNQWDEEWRNGYYGETTGEYNSSGNYMCTKNPIRIVGGQTYYYHCGYDSGAGARIYISYYDGNGSLINTTTWFNVYSDREFTVPSNARTMNFWMVSDYGIIYRNDICINLSDPAKNGTYEPYKKTVTQLNLGSFQVRDSQGNVTTITGGLKSAGSVYDEIVGNKYIKRVGSVDLGTLNWSNSGSIFISSSLNSIMKMPTSIAAPSANGICDKYGKVGAYPEFYDKDKAIYTTWIGAQAGLSLRVNDSAYTDAATFKTAMSGVMLNYELATPIEYELVTVPDYTYPVDGDGTERRLPEDTASSVHAPFRADILYALNGSATLRNLDANYVRNDNIKQTVGGDSNAVMSQDAVTREMTSLSNRINDAVKDIVDLSYIDPATGLALASRNTANTYVIFSNMNSSNRKFRFPIVYGNGIKNGVENPAAYTNLGGPYCADFVNHLGNTITSPWIERNAGCELNRVQPLWNTILHGLSMQLVDGWDGKYAEFTIPSSATSDTVWCVALLDSNNNIIWSWDIWYLTTATNLKPETIVNHTGVEYKMMPRPLCSIMTGTERFQCAYYQWGRKDVMGFPSAYNTSSFLQLYQGGDSFNIANYGVADDADAGGTARSVANSIKMPDKFFLEYDNTNCNWNNLPWMNNFWNAAETLSSDLADNQLTAIKTIYDPCPVGFMIPGPRAWTGFTSTGTNSSTASEFNVVGSFSNGWKFKKNSSDANGTFYPASGYRNRASGGLSYVGSYGYYWSFAPYSQTYARDLYFDSGFVYPLYNGRRADGFSVRPSREY